MSKEYGPWEIALSNNLQARTCCIEMDNQLNAELHDGTGVECELLIKEDN